MIEEKILTDVGLTELEAKVYLAALELGPAKVVQIAKQAEVKRPTAYVILDNLTKKGFVNKIQKEKTTLYSTQQPKMILNKYKEKLANFTDLIPYFEAKFNKGPKPKIRYYEGKDEIWNVYTQILFPSDELYFFGTDVEKLNKVFPDLFNYWEKKYSNKIKVYKEIVSENKAGIEYAKKNSRGKIEIRIMPKELPVAADSVITNTHLFIVSLDNLFGILIDSKDLALTYKNFFLLAWQAAKSQASS